MRPPLARWLPLAALLVAGGGAGCAASPSRSAPLLPGGLGARRCSPACARDDSCDTLDRRLGEHQKRFLGCVQENAARGKLEQTHRCYRTLRLLQSARWWLQTLSIPSYRLKVYQPDDALHQAFLCAIERLLATRTPEEVERRYLEMVRSYP